MQHDVKPFSGKFFTQFYNQSKRLNHYWLLAFQSILSLPFLMLKLYQDITLKKGKNKLEIAIDSKNIAIAITDAALSIVAVYIVKPLVFLVIATQNLLDNLLEMGLILYERFFVQGKKETKLISDLKHSLSENIQENKPLQKLKLTRLIKHMNSQHLLNRRLVNHAHQIAIGCITLVGSILALTPQAPVGTLLLSAIGLYSFIDYLGLNPLRLLLKTASMQKAKPFAIVSEANVIRDLKKDLNGDHDKSSVAKIYSALKNSCHPERSEGSPSTRRCLPFASLWVGMTRNAQDDINGYIYQRDRTLLNRHVRQKSGAFLNDDKGRINSLLPALNHPRQVTYSK